MSLSELIDKIRVPDGDGQEVPERLDGPEVDELADQVDPDPKPTRTAKGSSAKPPPAKVSAATRKEVNEKLTMLLGVPTLMWAQRDPFCAGVLNEQSEEIIKRLTAVACRNRRMLAWLTSTGEYTDWIMLFTAVWPVIAAVWSHHVARSVPDPQESGYGHPADFAPGADPFAGAAYGPEAWNGYRV